MSFWALKPGPERRAAKAKYEQNHPLATPTPAYPRPQRGAILYQERDGQHGYVGHSGAYHPFATPQERAVAIRLAIRLAPAIPPCLTIVDEGGLYAVGVSGRRYPLLDATPKLLRLSLRIATIEENNENTRADPGSESTAP